MAVKPGKRYLSDSCHKEDGVDYKARLPTDTAIYSALPEHGIHNADPSTKLDKKIQASGQGQLSELENHVIEDRYGTSKGLLAWPGPY